MSSRSCWPSGPERLRGPGAARSAMMAWSRVALTLPLACLLTGCAEVSPWERGYLAKPHMAVEPDPALAVLRIHAYRSREAAAVWGEATGGGAGCGCY